MKTATLVMRQIPRIALPIATGMVSLSLHGQIPEGPPTAITPNFSQDYQVAPIPGQPATRSSAQPIAPPSPFRYGPISVEPNLSYQITRETGVQATPGNPADVTNQSFTAGVAVQAGTSWNLSYTAQWMEYSSGPFQNGVDQNANLGGNLSLQDWNLDVSQSFGNVSDPSIETGRQTHQQSYGTNLRAFYGVGSSQPSLEMDFGQNIGFAALSPTIYDWSNQDWAHFPVSPQVDLAIGVGIGYTHEDPGFNMENVNPQAKIDWRPTTKLTLDAEAGVEESRYLTASRETSQTPIFSTNVSYQPWPTTTIGAGAARQLNAALLTNEMSRSTSVNVQVAQRLLTHYYLSVGASTGKTDYLSVNSGLTNVRGDTTDSLQASLRTMVLQRLNLSLTAARTHNASSAQGFGVSSNQLGFQAALTF